MRAYRTIVSGVIALLLLLPAYLEAATKFVRQDGSATLANANGPETSASACMSPATFNASTFAADDVVNFSGLGGTITTGLVLPSSGTAGHPITYQGTANVPTISVAGVCITSTSKSYLTISGFTLVSSGSVPVFEQGTYTDVTYQTLTITAPAGQFGIQLHGASASNATVKGITALTTTPTAVYVSATTHANLTITNITAPLTGVLIDNGTGGTVRSIRSSGGVNALRLKAATGSWTISDVASTAPTGYGLYLWNCSAATAIACTNITVNGPTGGANPAGVRVENSQNVTINDAAITGSSHQGVQVLAGSHDVTFNRVTVSGTTNYAWYLTAVHDVTLNQCAALGAGSTGFSVCDAVSYNITYNDCLARAGKGDGFLTNSDSHDVTYNRCRATQNGDKTTTAAGDGFTAHGNDYRIYLYHCIADRNTCTGMAMIQQSQGRIYNCTVYGNGGDFLAEGTGVTQIRAGIFLNIDGANPTIGGATNWTVRNCISVGNYPREVATYNAPTRSDLDYNCYKPLSDALFIRTVQAGPDTDWATYHATSEPHSINADPLFANATAGDFTITASSPAAEMGTNVGLDSDYRGIDIPQSGRYDLGAYTVQRQPIKRHRD